jgi:tRNA-splicing endonuclease subunit Sen54
MRELENAIVYLRCPLLERNALKADPFTQKPVDILVNAAGISTSNVLPRLDPSDISKVLRTNLEGSLLTSRALIRAAIRNRVRNRTGADGLITTPPSKCIINISSLLALKGGTGAVPYAASKAGILGLTRSLTVEAAETLKNQVIRSNVIVPGYIETPMIAGMLCFSLHSLFYATEGTAYELQAN